MSMIKAEHLTFAYPGSYDNIFENVSFQIDTDWKLGLIGRNGRGKTTFLRLLQGEFEYSGTIHASVQFDYFPYPVDDLSRMTNEVLSDVCPDTEPWKLIKELSYLGVDDEVLWRSFDTLSNGEQTKVLLAALFLNEGHFLLIDEPTNHLDAEARQMVAAYLKKKKGFILVSHDRAFLDGCIDHVLSINRANIEVQSGNFSSWFENFERQQEYERTQDDRLRKDIRQLKQAAKRASNWADKLEATKFGGRQDNSFVDRGFIGAQAARTMKRAKSFETRTQKAIDERSSLLKNEEASETLKLSTLHYHSDRLIELDNICIQYNGSTVCGPISFSVRRGERVLLSGRNGSGKSSILKLLLGHGVEHTGTLFTASNLVVSYVPQDTAHLHGLLKDYAEEHNLDESLFKAILRKMGFERVQFEKNISAFSGGQKKKVLIAHSLCQKAHVYIWDEPLNFIDIYSRMQIETLLREAAPTMIFVEHDRAFQNAIATKTIQL